MSRRYPDRPIIAVGALILRDQAVLLARRANEPFKGEWSLPGGAVEVGETLAAAVQREVREETGLEVDVLGIAGIFDRICRDEQAAVEFHYILVDFFCRPAGGMDRCGSDAEALGWFTRAQVENITIQPNTRELILRHLQ